MKKLMSYATLAVLITAFTALTGFAHGHAKTKTRTVEFNIEQNLMIGSTQVEKGEYKMTLNEETGELNVKSERTGKIVATVKGQLIENEKKAPGNELMISNNANGAVLTGLRFEGQKITLSLEAANGASGGSEQNN